MTSIDDLKQQELESLRVEADEVNIEDLIVLGETKKIPIHITYPRDDGTIANVRALVKQLTLKELENVKSKQITGLDVLQKAFFKTTGEPFTQEEISCIPIGVVRAVILKILELSGVDKETQEKLMNF